MARFYMEKGRDAESLDYWRTILSIDTNDLEAAYHVWRLMPDDPRIATLDDHRKSLLLAAHAGIGTKTTELDHVAICGVSYSGSTLLDRIFGGLRGVASIGESHWLIKCRTKDGEYKDFDFGTDLNSADFVPCSVCGRNCKILPLDFRLGLAADRRCWYQRIATRLGVNCVISSDKNLAKLLNNDPLLRFKALVIFKSPEQSWRSKLNKLPEGYETEFYLEECRKYIDVWTRSYRNFLDLFSPQGTTVFLSFDKFTEEPLELLRNVCRILDLQFDEGVLSRTVPGHAIGGNIGSMRRLRDADYHITIETLPDPDLPTEHAEMIRADVEMQTTYSDLIAMHRTTAEGVAVRGNRLETGRAGG